MPPLRASVALAALVTLVAAAPAEAAAPRIIMVTGAALAKPVFIADWSQNGRFMGEVQASPRVARRTLGRRPPPLRLSLFWGPVWDLYIRQGKPLAALRPDMAEQHGVFYPALRRRQAAIDVRAGVLAGLRRPTARLLQMLARNGVPVRLR